MKSHRGISLVFLAGMVLVNVKPALNLPSAAIAGVVRQPIRMPGLALPAMPAGVAFMPPGVVDERPARESLREWVRKIAQDPVAKERLDDVFDKVRTPNPKLPIF